MKAPDLTDDEARRLLIACADLPFLTDTRVSSDYVGCILETVLNFHMQATVVEKALAYFRNHVQHQHVIFEHHHLEGCLNAFPDTEEGNRAAARFLWQNAHWRRVEYLRRLLVYFSSISVTDQTSLYNWAHSAVYERDFRGRVKGLGIAVFHWLLIRCGVSSIKPDVWVLNFVERVVGRRLPEKIVVELFAWLSPLLGQPMDALDLTIWHYEKMGMAANDTPPLRVVFWNLLKSRVEAHIQDDSILKDLGWDYQLDEPCRLRYEAAGLTITAGLRLSGNPRKKMLARVQQSGWSQGLELRLAIREASEPHQKPLEKAQVQFEDFERLVNSDAASVVTMDLGDELRMPPTMTMEELKRRVEETTGRVVEGIRRWYD